MATTKATTLAHTLGGISSDISTAKFRLWMSTSNRSAAVQSREMHFMVIGAKA
jgi:hypothetical protein